MAGRFVFEFSWESVVGGGHQPWGGGADRFHRKICDERPRTY